MAALITALSRSRSLRAGTEKTAAETWAGLIAPLSDRVADQLARIAVLELQVLGLIQERDDLRQQVLIRDKKIDQLEAKIDLLTKQLVALGHKPFDAGA